jgi:hypothetical protein
MKQSTDKRIAVLEKAQPTSIGPFFIHFVGMDTKDSEIKRITKGNAVWTRLPSETEVEMKDRAIRETEPPKAGLSHTFLCW